MIRASTSTALASQPITTRGWPFRTPLTIVSAAISGEWISSCMPDGSFRFHSNGMDFGAMCMLGTFAERATISQHSVVKVDEWLPLETAVLVGCGVPSGWGTAVNAGNLRAGDTAVIYGVGGLGINAVQGAISAGCKYVVVVDPVALKRETALKFGATHAFADAASAARRAEGLPGGRGAARPRFLWAPSKKRLSRRRPR